VAMDRDNLSAIQRLRGDRGQPDVRLLRSFDADAPTGAAVPDPYAGGPDGFGHVLDLCESACRGLLAHVTARLT
ncbi:MAG: hypothetical protein H7138_21685, partial [Myxococcales bacterium]|nr:hypothetical protein [Myxococcales bacterium]